MPKGKLLDIVLPGVVPLQFTNPGRASAAAPKRLGNRRTWNRASKMLGPRVSSEVVTWRGSIRTSGKILARLRQTEKFNA
jgi:hypothetical protein